MGKKDAVQGRLSFFDEVVKKTEREEGCINIEVGSASRRSRGRNYQGEAEDGEVDDK